MPIFRDSKNPSLKKSVEKNYFFDLIIVLKKPEMKHFENAIKFGIQVNVSFIPLKSIVRDF